MNLFIVVQILKKAMQILIKLFANKGYRLCFKRTKPSITASMFTFWHLLGYVQLLSFLFFPKIKGQMPTSPNDVPAGHINQRHSQLQPK